MKRLITAADIPRGLTADGGSLYLEEDVIITPLARDKAKEMGLSLVVGATPSPAAEPAVGDGEGAGLQPAACVAPDRNPDEAFVRSVVAAVLTRLDRDAGGFPAVDASGTILVSPDGMPYESSGEAGYGRRVRFKRVLTGREGLGLSCRLWAVEDASFAWKADGDQIILVVAGELNLHIEDRSYRARAGDVLYVPADTQAKFECLDWARFFCVHGPAGRGN